MSQVFGFGQPIPQSALPPPSPVRSDPAIQRAADATVQNRARQGYASQFLTTPMFNHRELEPVSQRLGAR